MTPDWEQYEKDLQAENEYFERKNKYEASLTREQWLMYHYGSEYNEVDPTPDIKYEK